MQLIFYLYYMYVYSIIIIDFFLFSALADCVCSHCTNSNNCTIGIHDGHCTLGVHINAFTKEPEFIEQKCVVQNFISILACPVPRLAPPYPDLVEVCCEGSFCNECPLKLLVDAIEPEYWNLLYGFFPESCRENASFLFTSHISSTITHSPSCMSR